MNASPLSWSGRKGPSHEVIITGLFHLSPTMIDLCAAKDLSDTLGASLASNPAPAINNPADMAEALASGNRDTFMQALSVSPSIADQGLLGGPPLHASRPEPSVVSLAVTRTMAPPAAEPPHQSEGGEMRDGESGGLDAPAPAPVPAPSTLPRPQGMSEATYASLSEEERAALIEGEATIRRLRTFFQVRFPFFS